MLGFLKYLPFVFKVYPIIREIVEAVSRWSKEKKKNKKEKPTPEEEEKEMPTLESLSKVYISLWRNLKLTSRITTRNSAERLLSNKEKYQKAGESLGIPWYVVGLIHMRESTYNFGRHLHNGDSLKQRTWRVPKGRPATGEPPFTWEFSANDALSMKKWPRFSSLKGEELIANICFYLEQYNGWGYQTGSGQASTPPKRSPYLWSKTNAYQKGKYVSDGKFDKNAIDSQQGCMAILKMLVDMGEVDLGEGATIAKIHPNGVVFGDKQIITGNSIEKLRNALGQCECSAFSIEPEILSDIDKPQITPVLEKMLKKGAFGGQVFDVQKRLTLHGFNLEIDGDFGPETEARVKSFQGQKRLEIDGIVGPKTWASLWEKPSSNGPTPSDFTREELAATMEHWATLNINESNGKFKRFTKPFKPILGTDNFAWCGATIAAACEEAGLKVNRGRVPGAKHTFALVATWYLWAKKEGYWHQGTNGMTRGDIPLFDWNGLRHVDWDHIGCCLGRAPGGFLCSEGNYQDALKTATRYSNQIQGYIRIPDHISSIGF